MDSHTPTQWNGRLRDASKPCKPFFVLHNTESGSMASTVAYLRNVTRYAGYHAMADAVGIHICAGPEWRMYHAAHGGNDGLGVSGAYFVKDWPDFHVFTKWSIQTNMAKAVLALEAAAGFRVERIYLGGRAGAWDAHRDNPMGFWGHCDIQPEDRSDPGWDEGDWRSFFWQLDRVENGII